MDLTLVWVAILAWLALGMLSVSIAMNQGNSSIINIQTKELFSLFLKSFLYGPFTLSKLTCGTTLAQRKELERQRYKKALEEIIKQTNITVDSENEFMFEKLSGIHNTALKALGK